MPDSGHVLDPDPDRYLARLDLDPGDAADPDLATLRRLQRAHVTSVPFETLAVAGDPHRDRTGEGVTLTLPHLYEKVVERERGGYCFELNGAFGWLLREVGYDVDRVAARVVGDDGDATPPANHHSMVVHLDRPYVVDVGLGGRQLRRPLPLDGTPTEDGAGVAWRVVESDRPEAERAVEMRDPGDDDWSVRYLLDTEPVTLSYFAATCDYLQSSPESPFTGDPVVSLSTPAGYKKLRADELVRVGRDGEREEPVAPGEWHAVLHDEFGLDY